MTGPERLLWNALRKRQAAGYRFRRQCPIGPYIADFACLRLRLILEVDGGQHCDSLTDRARDHYLRRHGFRVLRFWNHEVTRNIAGVIEKILSACPAPGLSPPSGGRDER